MTPPDHERLEIEIRRMQETLDILSVRLERTLIALALTLDAQAATRQRLNDDAVDDELDLTDKVAHLQTTAEQYRQLARTVSNGNGRR
jgi:hypothetical protein